jgi:predicted RND superfamily exporter protein
MALAEQKRVIDAMRAALDPPVGVRAELVGLPVLAADANARIASPWGRLATLVAGLLAVGLVLAAGLRSLRRALVPLVPIVLATGWSALVLFATRVPLNPMSVTLGALVVAIATEFSVLLAERYRQERSAGRDPSAALERTYRSTGAAVLASGATAIAGFGVLALSDIRMLRDFGLVTVVDLTVALVGVLVALPAVLVLAEGRPALRRAGVKGAPRGTGASGSRRALDRAGPGGQTRGHGPA